MALSCCAYLGSAIPYLDIAYPNSPSYLATERSYSSLQEGSLTPCCVAKPTSSAEVAAIVSSVVSYGCSVAIKSQGHAPAAGFANIENGITVDLSNLKIDGHNFVSVSQDLSVASLSCGASWLDAYAFLDPLNKTVAGGRNGGVGVGGLILGGGISYFGPRVGWSCDTVQNFEMVLASGQLVNVNASSHPDLFRALKGGGNNFGILTRVDMATISTSEILSGTITNDISYRQEVFRAFVSFTNAPAYDVDASLIMGLFFNATESSKSWSLSSNPIYTKPVLHPPVYKELFAVPNITSSMDIRPISTYANNSALPQTSVLYYTGTYHVSVDLLDAIFNILNNTLQPISEPIEWQFAFEPLPTAFVSHGENDQNVLGTSTADGNGMIFLASGFWTNQALDSYFHSIAQDLMSQINKAAEGMNALHKLVYLNYADASQHPFESYGPQNEAFLHKVASAYDPSGVFQKLVPGGFKLRQ